MKNFSVIFIIFLVTSTHFHDLGVNAIHLTSTTHSKLLVSQKDDGFEIDSAELAKSCVSSLMQAIPPDFCWKAGGDVGIIPTGCPAGYMRSLALCFEKCSSGYRHILGICYKDCDSGYADHGLTCYKNLIRFYFKSAYIPKSLTNFSPSIVCPEGMYHDGALCYKDCNIIAMTNCGIGACSADKGSCAKSIMKMIYQTMKGALEAVLLVVSFGTSAAVGTAAKFSFKTAASKLGPVALKAAADKLKSQLTGQLAQIIRKKAMQQAKKAGLNFVKSVGKGVISAIEKEKAIESVCEPIFDDFVSRTLASTAKIGVDAVVSAIDIFDIKGVVDGCKDTSGDGGLKCAKNVVKSLSNFDPTGVLTIAASFMHPKCDNLTGTNNPDTQKAMDKLATVANGCIQLFKKCNYEGKTVTLCKDSTNLKVDFNFNDKVSSIITGPNATGLFFEHINYGGIAFPFMQEQLIPCLSDYDTEEIKMNDLISSVGFGLDNSILVNFKRNGTPKDDNHFISESKNDTVISLENLEFLRIKMFHQNMQLSLYAETNFKGTELYFDKTTDFPVSNITFKTVRSVKFAHFKKIEDGFYTIRNKNSHLFLAIKEGNTSNSVPVTQNQMTSNDIQIFYFLHLPDDVKKDTYIIEVKKTAKYLETSQDGTVVQNLSTDKPNQKWCITSNEDQSFTIVDYNNKDAMAIENGSKNVGALVKVLYADRSDNQKFFLESATV